ncbi:MAG: mechanosensitive ion channel family protein [Bacteroidales bacterium]|nr:mechanosensitive ion channel family protein [Bacteroidales bacterium]
MNNEFFNFLQVDNDDTGQILTTAAIALGAAIIIYIVTMQVIRKVSRRTDNSLEKGAHKKFRIPVLILLFSIALGIISSSFQTDNKVIGFLNHIFSLLIIFGISWLAIRIIKLGKRLVLKQYDVEQKDNLKARKVFTQFRIIERILVFIVILIALSAALMTFESIRKIGISLIASAGVAGVIIGFAAQKILSNVVAGIQIALAQPIRLDDVVIVEGEWGWIEEINLTYVVIRIWDKRRLVVPTTQFIEKPFQNWTRESSDILGTVFIYADYTVPVDKIREELTRILESDKNWDGKVNVLQVTNATEKTLELRALMSASDSPSAWNLRVNVREKLIGYLQKNYPDCLPRTRLSIDKEKNGSD